NAPRVAIVSETMARNFFRGAPAIGKFFREQDGAGWSPPTEIVGVVGDTKYNTLRDTLAAVVYYPQPQQEATSQNRQFELRTDVAPLAVAPAVKAVMAEFSPKIAIDLKTLSEQVAASTSISRAIAMLSGFFGGLALLLATIGLYGIMAYSVARRRNEIGVR